MLKYVSTDKAPAAIGPYSQAIIANNMVFASGQIPIDPATGKPFDRQRRTGFQCYWEALQLGALLRPLGDTLYFLPPLNCPDEVLDRLADIAAQAVLRSLRAPAEA